MEGPLRINDQQEGAFLLGFTITIYECNIFKKKFLLGKIVIAKINGKGSESIDILNSIKRINSKLSWKEKNKKIKN